MNAPRVSATQPLARREREVLRLIAEGSRSAAIATQLRITAATVEVHRRNIMRKLGLRTVAELTKYAHTGRYRVALEIDATGFRYLAGWKWV